MLSDFYRRVATKYAQSFMTRTLGLVAGSVLLAQLIVWGIWQAEWRAESSMALREVATNMALRVSATVDYFNSLPAKYRHIVLDQLREMRGGSYFVTLNREYIEINPLPENDARKLVIESFSNVLQKDSTVARELNIQFADPETLHVFNNKTLLRDLPNYWDTHTQLIQPYNLPILVLQIPISEKEWLYIATTVPSSLLLGEVARESQRLRVFGAILLILLLYLTVHRVREIIKPFSNLAKAAAAFGRDLKPVPLPEKGSMEVIEAIHAFNQMQDNVRQYMNDRKALFSGISHDLKTPLTRLRLRVAMMDDDDEREAMEQDLDYLDLMVKSALQTVRDTEVHENSTRIRLDTVLKDIVGSYPEGNELVSLNAAYSSNSQPEIVAKPLATRRCLENVIDNAIRYGNKASIKLRQEGDFWVISILDEGPGLPAGMEKEVFKPYVRLGHGKKSNPDGSGLGLMTARHLARTHGGDLVLVNHTEGGLEARLLFPVLM
ncbi:two-component sensor histidine kinase [Endozoicomonas sp. OPT23]|uniref:ATP-binding protein n=1 Tax=Endozoicomonas sp. OPT23 TaxID=2072845 RepID=UPI00129B181D|nr:ATP-binding protein [Endozoicomonas sp. OPT23]MRI35476.1 two-component sensor histidine kinase [Endozoicomonas sp. OPT23]